MHACRVNLNAHHVQCEGPFVRWADQLQNKVDQGEVVHSNLVLLLSNIGFHGDESEHAQ